MITPNIHRIPEIKVTNIASSIMAYMAYRNSKYFCLYLLREHNTITFIEWWPELYMDDYVFCRLKYIDQDLYVATKKKYYWDRIGSRLNYSLRNYIIEYINQGIII